MSARRLTRLTQRRRAAGTLVPRVDAADELDRRCLDESVEICVDRQTRQLHVARQYDCTHQGLVICRQRRHRQSATNSLTLPSPWAPRSMEKEPKRGPGGGHLPLWKTEQAAVFAMPRDMAYQVVLF